MKNKKEPNVVDLMVAFQSIMEITNTSNYFPSIFDGINDSKKIYKYPHECLGNGFELRKIEFKDKKGNLIDNRDNYSHLYHNDIKISNEVFRVGLGGKFKDGYCELIHYTVKKDPKKEDYGFSSGIHVIINELGEIVLSGINTITYPYHIGGCLGSIGNYIYDLRTGKAIAPKSSTLITGDNCVIIEHKYDWYDKEVKLPLGIYRIDFTDAGMIKIDDVRK